MSDNLYSIRTQIRHRINTRSKRNAEIEADDLARAYRAHQSSSRYRIEDGHVLSNISADVPAQNVPVIHHHPQQSVQMSDMRPPPKKSKFMFIGDFFDCDEQMEAFVKTQDKQSTEMSRTPNNNEMEDEIASLIYENNDLQSKFTNLTKEYDIQSGVVNQKVSLINSLQAENARLKEENNSLRNQGIYNPMIENPSDDQIFNVITQTSIDTLNSNQNEIKSLLLEIKAKMDRNATPNSVNQPIITVAGTDDETVLLPPNHSLAINRDRYSHARASQSASAYVQKLLTAIFSFHELIGATLSGGTHPSSEKNKKRKEEGEGGSETRKVRSLSNTKVCDIVESAIHFFPKASRSELRKSIGWKLSKLNGGVCSKMDRLKWEGFDQAIFDGLVTKKNPVEGEPESNSHEL